MVILLRAVVPTPVVLYRPRLSGNGGILGNYGNVSSNNLILQERTLRSNPTLTDRIHFDRSAANRSLFGVAGLRFYGTLLLTGPAPVEAQHIPLVCHASKYFSRTTSTSSPMTWP